MKMDQIIKLIKEVSNSNLSSFIYTEGNLHLELKNERISSGKIYNINEKESMAELVKENEISNQEVNDESKTDKIIIKSPTVGTFYSAGSEDSAPYIEVGDLVKKGQVVCIVEAMKLMNEIESEYDGIVEEILVENEDVVEFGQGLIVLKPMPDRS